MTLYILRKKSFESLKRKKITPWSKIYENLREEKWIDYFKHSDAELIEFVRFSSPDTLYIRLSLSLFLSLSLSLSLFGLCRSHPRLQKIKSAPFEFDPTDVYPATFRFLVPQGNADASPRWYITVSWKTPSEIREPWASSGFTYECMIYYQRLELT